jgi:hypothetical protein
LVDLVLLQSVSYVAAAIGVCVAAVYYVMNLQMARRKMKLDNTLFYGNLITNKEMVLQWRHVLFDQQFQSFEEWENKYRSDPEAYSNFRATLGLLDMIGMCVKEDLIVFDMLAKRGNLPWILAVYPKVKPVIMGYRVLYNDPSYGSYSEYLYEEAVKRYPNVKMSRERAQLIMGVDK